MIVSRRRNLIRLTAGVAIAATLLSYLPPLPALVQAAASDTVDLPEIKGQIEDINDDVANKKAAMNELDRRISEYRELVSKKQSESIQLEEDIAALDNSLERHRLDIAIVNGEISILEMELGAIGERIADTDRHIARERKLIATVSRKLYRSGFRRSLLEVLLSYNSFSSFFDGLQTMVELEGAVHKALARLQAENRNLAVEKEFRDNKEKDLSGKKRQLEIAKHETEDERMLKNSILVETKSSELEYRYLIADLRQEQNDANSDIQDLERKLRDKLDIADRLSRQETILSWPVTPDRGLSTIFHDPDYPFRYVFEHPGIDIRSPQMTPVRSAAAGVVARAKNAGYGYNYVMILHNNNISTVYGHLTKITAREDAYVERGEIIGYSGGMPGTPGAGRLTTGPHLHFETRIQGIPTDPLQYLTKF